MKLKHLFRLSFFTFLVSLIACNSSDYTETLSSDAEITAFKLAANDSVIESLDSVFFSIDQQKGLIYNSDSLPVGTTFKNLLANISFYSASKAIIRYSSGDTANYSSSDSINFSAPFKIEVVAYNGTTKKIYDVRLNVHKQEPDSMQWNQLSSNLWNFDYASSKTILFNDHFLSYFDNGATFSVYTSSKESGTMWVNQPSATLPQKAVINSITAFNGSLYMTTTDNLLYQSTDGLSWNIVNTETSGFVALLGILKDQNGQARMVIERKDSNNSYYLASTSDGASFTNYTNVILPTDFPVKDFATISGPESKSNKLSIIGGVNPANEILNTLHQMYCDKSGFHIGYNINNNDIDGYQGFTNRKGAVAFYYDNRMMVGLGKSDTKTHNDIYTSKDNGVSWQRQDSLINFPKTFTARAYSSAVINSSTNDIWLFGGMDNSGSLLKEAWRGKINRLGFIIK